MTFKEDAAMAEIPCENTDREIWREQEGDFYSASIFVTESGGIGINVGGLCIVKSVRDWHNLGALDCGVPTSIAESIGYQPE